MHWFQLTLCSGKKSVKTVITINIWHNYNCCTEVLGHLFLEIEKKTNSQDIKVGLSIVSIIFLEKYSHQILKLDILSFIVVHKCEQKVTRDSTKSAQWD